MNRRTFLKSIAGSAAAVFAAQSGIALAEPPHQIFNPQIVTSPIHPTLASNSTDAVGLRLVCIYDVSGSIDETEHKFQLDAMANALETKDFQDAIFYRGGPQSIAISFVDFGDDAAMRIPWVDIRKGDGYKLPLLANEVRQLRRREDGGTNHVGALKQAIKNFDVCPWKAERTIIDVLTDGEHNAGAWDLTGTRETLTKQYEATINALITIDEDDLEDWTKEKLVTPPGHIKRDGRVLDAGFVKVVGTQQSSKNPGALIEYHQAVEMAFRRKLILEVAGIELEELHKVVAAEQAEKHLFLPTTKHGLGL